MNGNFYFSLQQHNGFSHNGGGVAIIDGLTHKGTVWIFNGHRGIAHVVLTDCTFPAVSQDFFLFQLAF